MPPVTRRDVLRTTLAASLLPLLPACGDDDDDGSAPADATGQFLHGVASGDPLPDAVILWTRVTPDDPLTTALRVDWELGLDAELARPALSGRADAEAGRDYTVKIDVVGLEPGQTYRTIGDRPRYLEQLPGRFNCSILRRPPRLPGRHPPPEHSPDLSGKAVTTQRVVSVGCRADLVDQPGIQLGPK